MKKRNKIIPLILGTVLSLSMASVTMAGAASVQMTAAGVTKTPSADTKDKKADEKKKEDTEKDKRDDKKELLELFGRIKKVNKNGIEIETATIDQKNKVSDGADERPDEKDSPKAVDKKDTKKQAGKKEQKKESEEKTKSKVEQAESETKQNAQDVIELVLDGKMVTVNFEKDTVIYREMNLAEEISEVDTNGTEQKKNKDTKVDAEVKTDAEAKTDKDTRQIIKLEELKENDIVKIMIEKESVKEVTVLTAAKILEQMDETELEEAVADKEAKNMDKSAVHTKNKAENAN